MANETQLSDISLTSGPVPTPALVDPHHLSLSKGRETQWACIVSLPHDITQGHAGPLTAFSQSLPVWSSWVRLPSAWLWWVATPAALPLSFHPRASPSPWWSLAGEAPACSCLSSFPETGGNKSQCSSSEYIWFFQVISNFVMFCLRSTYNTVFQKQAGLSENQNFKTR